MALRKRYEQKCSELCCEPIQSFVAQIQQAEDTGCAQEMRA